MQRRDLMAIIAAAPSLFACGGLEAPPTRESSSPLTAYCQAQVTGKGSIDVETDYIPHVVACENGAAPIEALRAQAVAARTYLYYKLETSGSIADGASDQVYTCGRPLGSQHLAAARDTAGEVLTYHGDVIAAFFVAGAIPSAASCIAVESDSDPTNTERYVTYNEGLSGANVHQTTLGFVSATNYRNRGCQSQNGASCLARRGAVYPDILMFYYGMDIGREAASGPCVPNAMMIGMSCRVVAAGDTIVDEAGMCFTHQCASIDRFVAVGAGLGGHQFTVPAESSATPDCSGRWNLGFEAEGDYAVAAYTTSASPRAKLTYRVRHAGWVDAVAVDQATSSGTGDWAPLGTYRFAAGQDQWVELGDDASEPPASGAVVVFDGLRVTAADTPPGVDGIARAGGPGGGGPPVSATIDRGHSSSGCVCVDGPTQEYDFILLFALAALGCARRRSYSVAR
jgi:stage II sporulation SpoD-like protein